MRVQAPQVQEQVQQVRAPQVQEQAPQVQEQQVQQVRAPQVQAQQEQQVQAQQEQAQAPLRPPVERHQRPLQESLLLPLRAAVAPSPPSRRRASRRCRRHECRPGTVYT